MARNPEDKTKKSLLRILKIWEDRGIYESPLIKEFESSYRKTWDDLNGPDVDELLEEAIENPKPKPSHPPKDKIKSGKSGKHSRKDKERESRKRHHHHAKAGGDIAPVETSTSTSTSPAVGAEPATAEQTQADKDEVDAREKLEKRRKRSKGLENLRKRAMMEDDMNTIQEWEVDGVSQMEIKLSPSPYKDPPTEEELLACIKVT